MLGARGLASECERDTGDKGCESASGGPPQAIVPYRPPVEIETIGSLYRLSVSSVRHA